MVKSLSHQWKNPLLTFSFQISVISGSATYSYGRQCHVYSGPGHSTSKELSFIEEKHFVLFFPLVLFNK